ncbi:Uncharacterised protein [Klebsiella pneumoniae]|nr:Uncharacterised protein [Klebsiella pneumoniae]
MSNQAEFNPHLPQSWQFTPPKEGGTVPSISRVNIKISSGRRVVVNLMPLKSP